MTTSEDPTRITAWLERWNDDVKASLDSVFPALLPELRRLAASLLSNEPEGQTLVATALVHELYLKLLQRHSAQWENRQHFISFGVRTMRRILVDRARRRATDKRGGELQRVTLQEAHSVPIAAEFDWLALDAALEELEALDPRLVRVVELRVLFGLTIPEVAELLEIGTATVSRDWSTARAWLRLKLTEP